MEERLTNLENLVNSLIKKIEKDKEYINNDISALRTQISDLKKEVEESQA